MSLKLSEITDSASPPALTDTLVGVGGGIADYQYTLSQIQAAISRIILTSDVSFYVNASTGSDSNNGSSGSPFATIGYASLIIGNFDYNYQYFPTINVADGNYNEQVILPALVNCPSGGSIIGNTTTPSNCTVTDLGTACSFTIPNESIWTIDGFGFPGTFGAFYVGFTPDFTFPFRGGTLAFDNVDFSGAYSTSAISSGPFSFVSCFNGNMTVSAATMSGLWQAYASTVLNDGATLTFTANTAFDNSITFLDRSFFSDPNYVNYSGVTCASNPLFMVAGCSIEPSPASFEDYPGYSANPNGVPAIDQTCTYGSGANGTVSTLTYEVAPSTGDTASINFGARNAIINPAGTLASLTVNLPIMDAGMIGESFTCSIQFTQDIISLTLANIDGFGLIGAPTSASAGQVFKAIFSSALAAWVVSSGGSSGGSSWTPLDIPDLVAFYRADIGVTQSGGSVSQWNDQSTNAYNLTPSGSSNPTFSSTGFAEAYPGISFDGASQFLQNTGVALASTSVSTFMLISDSPTELNTNNPGIIALGANGVGNDTATPSFCVADFGGAFGGQVGFYSNGILGNGSSALSIPTAWPQLVGWIANGTSVNGFIRGQLVGTASSFSSTIGSNPNTLKIGQRDSNFWEGSVGFVIITSSAMTYVDVANLVRWSNANFGTAL